MVEENTFRTKTGTCHILPDKIVLTRNGVVGNLANVVFGNSLLRSLLINGVLNLWLFYSGFVAFKSGEILLPIVFGLIGLYFLYGIIISLNNSASPIIYRDKIRELRFKRGFAGLTRSRFEVMFENEDGKIKRRMIMLPGSLSNGNSETKKAIELMRTKKLLS